MTHQEHLAELKTLLVEGKEFDKIYTYFFDHLGENNDFLRLGKKDPRSGMESVLEVVTGEMFKKRVKIDNLMAFRIPNEPFLHGTCMIEASIMTFFFFEDIAVGLAGLMSLLNPTHTLCVRFTGQKAPPPPSVN